MHSVEITQVQNADAMKAVVAMHGAYYGEHWGFGPFFEAKVGSELAEFLSGFTEGRDGFWVASADGAIHGSIAIDGSHAAEDGAHLRWFIVSDSARGRGVGQQLMDAAVQFCRSAGFERIYLWTFEGLAAAKHLYTQAGFTCTEQRQGEQWGTRVLEQRFECDLSTGSRD